MKNLASEAVALRQVKPIRAVCRAETEIATTSDPVVCYTVFACPLGRLLLAATEQGVCAICIGDDDAALAADLTGIYPAAAIRRDDAGLADWAGALLRHLDGRKPSLNLPIDVRATPFQRRVWQELAAIPPGRTRSYSEVARLLGRPTAARAVARACATNPVAVLIPCHRVVREGGGLGGYRWGLERKKSLLKAERAAAGLTGRCDPPADGSGA